MESSAPSPKGYVGFKLRRVEDDLILKHCKAAISLWSLSFSLLIAMATAAQTPRMVLIDQDGSGPGGSNQMAMMLLLQSPQVRVLGITMVSGNAWEPEEVEHTLRMLGVPPDLDVKTQIVARNVPAEDESF